MTQDLSQKEEIRGRSWWVFQREFHPGPGSPRRTLFRPSPPVSHTGHHRFPDLLTPKVGGYGRRSFPRGHLFGPTSLRVSLPPPYVCICFPSSSGCLHRSPLSPLVQLNPSSTKGVRCKRISHLLIIFIVTKGFYKHKKISVKCLLKKNNNNNRIIIIINPLYFSPVTTLLRG